MMVASETVHRVLDPAESLVADLSSISTGGADGVVWAVASAQLNANLVSLGPDGIIQEHRNDEVDVLVIVVEGDGVVSIDGVATPVAADSVVLISAGSTRSIAANRRLVYYSVHVRRPGPAVGGRS